MGQKGIIDKDSRGTASDALLGTGPNREIIHYRKSDLISPAATGGSTVTFDKDRNYGEGAPLSNFAISLTGAERETVVSVFVTGFSVRPAVLNDSKIYVAEEPAEYLPGKQYEVILRYISGSIKIQTTISEVQFLVLV